MTTNQRINTRSIQNIRLKNLEIIFKKLLQEKELPQVDRWLSLEFAKNKKFGSKDRKWYSDQIFSIFRHGIFALFATQFFYATKKEEKNTLFEFKDLKNFLDEYLKEIEDPKNFFDSLKKIHFQGFIEFVFFRSNHINELESTFEENNEKFNFYLKISSFIQSEHDLKYKLIFYSIPYRLEEYIDHRIHLQIRSDIYFNSAQFFENLNSRPPLWVRLNHLDKKTEFIHELKKENYSYSFSSKENVLEISGQKSVFLLESFKKGIFEIQDYASTEIVDTFTPYKGSYVWDACAGGGGKTIHIASKLMNKGVIYATDIREYKLGEIKNRAKKAQFFNIRTQVWDGIKLPVFGKEIQNHGGFDFILVDAPCSSSGTWRRNPDAKYRIEKKNINELSRLQIMLLNNASKMLHNKGTLIYATCSFFIEENEKIVEQFLQQNPEIKIINQKLLGNPEANSDTMFVAVFRK